MEYNLKIKDMTIACDLTIKQDRNLCATIGDTPFEIHYDRISDHQIRLMVNGQQVNAWIEETAEGKTIILGGERFFIQDRDLLAQTQPRKKGLDNAPSEVTPPMPAVVIFVPVQPGDTVEKGDTVVVVSAMKMETSLIAPHGGTVTRVGVAEGDKVMPGDILIDIDKIEIDEIDTDKIDIAESQPAKTA